MMEEIVKLITIYHFEMTGSLIITKIVIIAYLWLNFHKLSSKIKLAISIVWIGLAGWNVYLNKAGLFDENFFRDTVFAVMGGLAVAYFTERFIKNRLRKQEQEARFKKGQDAYDDGEYDNIGYHKAINIWRRLALLSGHIKAQYKLGKVFENGIAKNGEAIVEEDEDEAKKWYSFAAYQGHSESQYRLGIILYKNKENDKALFWLKQSVKNIFFSTRENAFWKNAFYIKQSNLSQESRIETYYSIGEIYQKNKEDKNENIAERWYYLAADRGHMEAQFKLGLIYEKKQGAADALEWYEKASYQGHDIAITKVISIYEGQGKQKEAERWKKIQGGKVSIGDLDFEILAESDSDTFNWIDEVAKRGLSEAQFKHGYMLDNGYGITRSDKKALKSYETAAKRGEIKAQFALAIMHRAGNGVEQDDEKAIYWFKESAKYDGNVGAQFNIGHMYLDGMGVEQNYEKALEWFKKAAGRGHEFSQYAIGTMYEDGQGVEQSYEEALRWYKKAAAEGHAKALLAIGIMHYKGEGGIEKNDEEAIEYFIASAKEGSKEAQKHVKDAAKQGHSGAQFSMGNMYIKEGHHEEASEYFREAAMQGHVVAQFNMGDICRKEQYYEDAFKWFREAAMRGHVNSQYNIALMHWQGQGVEENLIQACKWAIIAKVNDSDSAEALIKDIVTKISSEDIAKAEEMAKRCIESNYEDCRE